MPVLVGLQGVVYYGTPNVARTSWATTPNSYNIYTGTPTGLSSAPSVRDVTVNLEAEEADVSNRGSFVQLVIQGLQKWPCEVSIPYNPTDAFVVALRDCFFGRFTIGVAILDQPATTGVYGVYFDASVMGFQIEEPLPKEMMLKVKLCPAYPSSGTFVTPQAVICA